jgi:trimeric autotransporter adhesin
MGPLGIKDSRQRGNRFHPRLPVALVGFVLLAMLAVGVTPATATAALYPPVAGSAVKTAEGFELRGTVYPYGYETTWHFEYGTSTAYGLSAPMPDADAGTATAVPVSQLITGLEPDTTYHFRLVSTNTFEGTSFSADHTFSTAAAPTIGGSTARW